MKLFGTYPSHFTRKVRIVLQELGLEYQFSVLTSLLETGSEHFAGNPLQRLPSLEDGGLLLIESDVICRYLIDKYGRNSPNLRFLPSGGNVWEHEKRLAVANGGMAAGVELIRAKRSNIPDYANFTMFRQEAGALKGALRWLDQDLDSRTAYQAGELTVADIALHCFADWAVFREFVPNLDEYPSLRAFVAANKARPSFASTHPALEAPRK